MAVWLCWTLAVGLDGVGEEGAATPQALAPEVVDALLATEELQVAVSSDELP